MLFKKSYVIVNKYNNTYTTTTKMKLTDVKPNTYVDSSKENNDKNPKLNMVTLLEYQNIKIFLQKFTLQIGLKMFLWLKKLKMLRRGHMLLIILMRKKLL